MKLINKNIILASILIMFISFTINASNLAGHENIEKDIVSIAVENGSFSTLATALQEADLIETLKSDGPFTVFAPTDAAFSKLPDGTIENLLKDKEALKNILMYHVVSGNYSSNDVVKYSSAKTLSGESFNISISENNVSINDSHIITTDIKAKNGVIHIIDSVLLPSN